MNAPKNPRLVAFIVLSALAAIAYGASLGGGFLNWDDPTYIQNNPEVHGGAASLASIFSSFHFANYNPLHRLSYWVEWQCFGANGTAFRITNLLLHAANGILLFALLRTWRCTYFVALVAAALFVVHPANVETVAWISERKSLLATAFAFASTICWLRANDGSKHARWLALGLFAIGMLCKTSIVVLPVLLFALDFAGRAEWRRRLGWYAAFLVPAIALGVAQIQAAAADAAVRPLHGGSLVTHVATIVAVLPSYAIDLVFPFGLTPRHVFESASLTDARFFVGLATLGAVAWGMVKSWHAERRFAVAACWALTALLVTLIVPIPIILADRYWYFAMPLLLAVGVEWIASRPLSQPRVATIATPVCLGLMTVATLDYALVWRDSTALWTHTISKNPNDTEAWVSLGAARLAVGDLRGAHRSYSQAVRQNPNFIEAVESLASVELQAGQITSAQQRLSELLTEHPNRGKARAMFAATFDLQGDPGRARTEFQRGLAATPDDAVLLFNFVNFCERHRQRGDARRALEAFVERHPDHAPARDALFRLSSARATPGR